MGFSLFCLCVGLVCALELMRCCLCFLWFCLVIRCLSAQGSVSVVLFWIGLYVGSWIWDLLLAFWEMGFWWVTFLRFSCAFSCCLCWLFDLGLLMFYLVLLNCYCIVVCYLVVVIYFPFVDCFTAGFVLIVLLCSFVLRFCCGFVCGMSLLLVTCYFWLCFCCFC